MYYKIIDNKQYDKKLLELADSFIQGQGDGRISKPEMQTLLEAVQDANRVTDIEKDTLQYIIDHYNCTASAMLFYKEHFKEA
jgi:hypothetical protein